MTSNITEPKSLKTGPEKAPTTILEKENKVFNHIRKIWLIKTPKDNIEGLISSLERTDKILDKLQPRVISKENSLKIVPLFSLL